MTNKPTSLSEYISNCELDVNTTLTDGAGVHFPLKGKEIEAAVLFVDMTDFSTRSLGLPPQQHSYS